MAKKVFARIDAEKGKLLLFKRESDTTPKSTISLAYATLDPKSEMLDGTVLSDSFLSLGCKYRKIVSVSVVEGDAKDKDKGKLEFDVQTAVRTYHFQAISEAELYPATSISFYVEG